MVSENGGVDVVRLRAAAERLTGFAGYVLSDADRAALADALPELLRVYEAWQRAARADLGYAHDEGLYILAGSPADRARLIDMGSVWVIPD